MGDRHLYLNFDDPRLLVLISGYPRLLTSFFYMTLRSQDQAHGGDKLHGPTKIKEITGINNIGYIISRIRVDPELTLEGHRL